MYRWHFGVHGRSKMGDKWSKKEKGGEGVADALRIDSVLILSIYGLFKQRSRLNFSDEDSIWNLSSSKFNPHLSFGPFFDLSSVV